MLTFWGTTNRRRYLGRRADYCQLCRAVRPMTRSALESVGHFYYIPMGPRSRVGVREYCETCGSSYIVEDDPTVPLEWSRRADLETLIVATNPDVDRRNASALGLSERARSGRVTAEEKRSAIRDALVCANTLMSDRAGGFHLDTLSWISVASVVAVPAAIMTWAERNADKIDPERAEAVAAGAILFFVFSTLLCVSTDAKRFFRRKVRPALARALAVLDPAADEIDHELAAIAEEHDVIGRFLDGTRLRDAIDRVS